MTSNDLEAERPARSWRWIAIPLVVVLIVGGGLYGLSVKKENKKKDDAKSALITRRANVVAHTSGFEYYDYGFADYCAKGGGKTNELVREGVKRYEEWGRKHGGDVMNEGEADEISAPDKIIEAMNALDCNQKLARRLSRAYDQAIFTAEKERAID